MTGVPKLAIINLPHLVDLFDAAGFVVLSSQTDPVSVTAAVREADARGERVLVISAPPDSALTAWFALQVRTASRAILVLHSPQMPVTSTLPPQVRTFELPSTLDEIMANFRAPKAPEPFGASVVDASGQAALPSADDDDEEHPDDVPFDWGPPAPAPVPSTFEPPAPAPVPSTSLAPAPTQAPVRVPRSRRELAPVIVVVAAKGGVGKSTMTLSLAQAACNGSRRVAVIDGNRGQADLGKYLRVSRSNLPTLHDAAVLGDPGKAIIHPDRSNKVRGARLSEIGFAVVLGPRAGQENDARDQVCDEGVYAAAVEELRRRADLVIIDTQISETPDVSGLFDRVWVPLLAEPGNWLLAINDSTWVGLESLWDRIRSFQSRGVPHDRTLLVVSRANQRSGTDDDQRWKAVSEMAKLMGVIPHDKAISDMLNLGEIPWEHPDVYKVVRAVLHLVTGDPEFLPVLEQPKRGFRFPLRRRSAS